MTDLPQAAWQKVSADLMGPFPTGESLLVMVDYYSRFPVVEILKSTTSSALIQRMHQIFAVHGLPHTLVTDNGPQLISAEFAAYLQECGIKHHRVTPLWPRANGEVERFNRVLKKAIQTAHSEGKDWKFELFTFLLAY
jgi:transposase InsO family protein